MPCRATLFGAALALLVACVACERVPAESSSTPEGARFLRYDFVPLRQRTERIEWVEDLVIGDRGADLDYAFGTTAPRVTVDAGGHIYVLDTGNHRVQVFADTGGFALTFGSRGQGPCEFDFGSDRLDRLRPPFFIDEGRLVVFSRPGRLSLWNRRGECLGEAEHPLFDTRLSALRVAGAAGGQLIAQRRVVVEGDGSSPTTVQAVGLFEIDDGELREVRRFVDGVTGPGALSFAAQSSGSVYAATRTGVRTRQRLTAFGADGGVRWIAEMPWPPSLQGSANVKLDGHGHIYVFLGNRQVDDDSETFLRMVDVYSVEGERLFAGTIDGIAVDWVWQDTRDELLYGIDQDPQTAEWRVVRSRLREPFR